MPPMTTDVVGILRRTDLLRSVPPADREAVAAAFPVLPVAAGGSASTAAAVSSGATI